jgi:hypothetical protein
MIGLTDYLNAGFTPEQAALLVQRDQSITQQISMLQAAMNEGFTNVLISINGLLNAMNTRFDRLENQLRGVNPN